MKAVGLAGVAHARSSLSLLKSARQQYVKAIEATNAALRSPLQVKKDSVLISIMVLSIFETVTGANQKSLQDWAEHLMGAAALIKVRGIEQLNSANGRRMFIQLTASLMIASMRRGCTVLNLLTIGLHERKWKEEKMRPSQRRQELR